MLLSASSMLLLLVQGQLPDEKKALDQYNGLWQVDYVEQRGIEVTGSMLVQSIIPKELEIKNGKTSFDSFGVRVNAEVDFRSRDIVDTIDIKFPDSMTKLEALSIVNDSVIILSLDLAGASRPKTIMSTTKDESRILIIYKRQKKR